MYHKIAIGMLVGALLSLSSTLVMSQEKEKEVVPEPKAKKVLVLYTASQCGPVNEIANMLTQKYGEIPFAVGQGLVTLAQNGQITPTSLVLTVNPETKTFTVNALMPDMTTCLLMSGKGFSPAKTTAIKKKTKIIFSPQVATRYNFPKLDVSN